MTIEAHYIYKWNSDCFYDKTMLYFNFCYFLDEVTIYLVPQYEKLINLKYFSFYFNNIFNKTVMKR